MSWSADGKTLVLSITDPFNWRPHHTNQIQFWNVSQKLLSYSIPVSNRDMNRLTQVRLSPDNATVALELYAEEHFSLTWGNVKQGKLFDRKYGTGPFVFAPDSRQTKSYALGYKHENRAGIETYDVHTGKELSDKPLPLPSNRSLYGYCPSAAGGPGPTWAFSPDSKLGAVGLLKDDVWHPILPECAWWSLTFRYAHRKA
ncbi:MAG: hypothetical protein JOZ57_05235 [Abitibacteriaceae bacterium]|nr:hypothetical protein [Abditibacteriaceae bacterium]